jgi:hypothetical protein
MNLSCLRSLSGWNGRRSADHVLGGANMTTKPKPICTIEADGHDMFVIWNGVKIAKRGHPGTPQAGQWVALEPGFKVYSSPNHIQLVIEQNGTRLQ